MTYSDWFQTHSKKHKKIVEKLVAKNCTKEQIVEYFKFENMAKNESDFCPLYAENKKCHDMKNLNCYLCACPNFRFNDNGIEKVDGKTKYSYCSIESKEGKTGIYGDAIHQDCSNCLVPHAKSYILKNFSLDLREVMKDCEEK